MAFNQIKSSTVIFDEALIKRKIEELDISLVAPSYKRLISSSNKSGKKSKLC